MTAALRHVHEVRKSTLRAAATWEASQWTMDMTVLATFASLDCVIILGECRRDEAKSDRFLGQGVNAAHFAASIIAVMFPTGAVARTL